MKKKKRIEVLEQKIEKVLDYLENDLLLKAQKYEKLVKEVEKLKIFNIDFKKTKHLLNDNGNFELKIELLQPKLIVNFEDDGSYFVNDFFRTFMSLNLINIEDQVKIQDMISNCSNYIKKNNFNEHSEN